MINNYRDIIKSPIISEKATGLQQVNKYVFSVDIKANKTHIKQAVENIFNVEVETVNTINVKPKRKRVRRYSGNYFGKRNKVKKAIVTLKKGQTIEV